MAYFELDQTPNTSVELSNASGESAQRADITNGELLYSELK